MSAIAGSHDRLRHIADHLETETATAAIPTRQSYTVAKRAFDLVAAALALVLLSPLFFVIAVAIALTSPGPIIFSQVRCGQGGRRFRCYKFRTMVPDADRLLERDPQLMAAYLQQWKLVDDPRITPVGAILRKTSLDELPQVWNVLRGEMSIVGPRPVQPRELRDHYGTSAAVVTLARPGMTGLWQISGRSSVPYETRVALDVDYVRRRSLAFDLLIILRTIPALLAARGAD